jgi:hypothetical protein
MPEPEAPRAWYFCEFCNRVLYVGDPCDCPKSVKKAAKDAPEPAPPA